MEAAGAIKQDDEISESDQIVNLTSEGINAGDVKELQDVGIYTCNDLMMHYNESPTGMKGLSKAMAEMIHESAENLLSQGFMSGSDLFSEESVVRITTENESLAIAPVSVVTDTTDTSKKVMLVAGAVAASSCGHGQSWGFLHREVLFDDAEGVDLDLFKPSPIPVGADFGINRLPLVTSSSLPGGVRHEMIPLVSVISIRRSLFHVSAHAIAGLVKCTDPEGSILIEVSQEQGTELLLVCRPGSGKARCLPAVPVSLGVNVSTSGTGIVSDHCGSKEDFIVVQLQTSSSQSPQVLNVLCFESKDSTWRVMEVRFEHCFTAHTVTSHSGGLVFLDPDHGMIRFDPCKNEPVTIIPFPGVENTEPTDPRHQYITSSEGRLCHIRIHGVPYEPKGVFGLAVAVKKAAMGCGL